MTRARTNKLYRTFTRGLITEASPLTYPEDASIDELNTVISRKGNRTRRVGIDFQDDYALEDLDVNSQTVLNEYVWNSVNNDAEYNFVVLQIGHMIYFYRLDEGPVSANRLPFSINLEDYVIAGASSTKIRKEFADFTGGSGYLFIAHRYCTSLSVEYDVETNTIDVLPVYIDVRDLEGIDDGLANDEEPKQLSVEHHYNLQNQGWVKGKTVSGTGSSLFPPSPGSVSSGSEGNVN